MVAWEKEAEFVSVIKKAANKATKVGTVCPHRFSGVSYCHADIFALMSAIGRKRIAFSRTAQTILETASAMALEDASKVYKHVVAVLERQLEKAAGDQKHNIVLAMGEWAALFTSPSLQRASARWSLVSRVPCSICCSSREFKESYISFITVCVASAHKLPRL